MFKYGSFRLTDLYKEHGHQCADLKKIIESFRNGKTVYTSDQLLAFIRDNILSRFKDIVIENKTTVNALDIAHFLYRIGFITLDDDSFENGSSYIRFEDIPDLLIEANYDPEDLWAVHPSYRTVLHLKQPSKQ